MEGTYTILPAVVQYDAFESEWSVGILRCAQGGIVYYLVCLKWLMLLKYIYSGIAQVETHSQRHGIKLMWSSLHWVFMHSNIHTKIHMYWY